MRSKKNGSCHCGAVCLEIEFSGQFDNLRRCDCSLCARKGAVLASVPIDQLRISKGQDKLTLYQWNTKTARHYFCSICGIYTHHQRRSNSSEYGINIACFEGVEVRKYVNTPYLDGKNHPADQKSGLDIK